MGNDPNLSQFEDFIRSMNMDGVSGFSCETVRPKLDELIVALDPGTDVWGHALTERQRSIRQCLSCRIVSGMMETFSDGEPLSYDQLVQLIMATSALAMIANDRILNDE